MKFYIKVPLFRVYLCHFNFKKIFYSDTTSIPSNGGRRRRTSIPTCTPNETEIFVATSPNKIALVYKCLASHLPENCVIEHAFRSEEMWFSEPTFEHLSEEDRKQISSIF